MRLISRKLCAFLLMLSTGFTSLSVLFLFPQSITFFVIMHSILDYFSVEWEDLLKTDELNADNSTRMYLDKTNILLDTYTPLKRINKYKMKFKSKPWLTKINICEKQIT